MNRKHRKVIRTVIIVLALAYVIFLHFQRMGYMRSLEMILTETDMIEGSAYYEAAPKDLKNRVRNIGAISSKVLNIPSQDRTVSSVLEKSQ